MTSKLFTSFCLILLTGSVFGQTNNIQIGLPGSYIYKNALHASILFFEAQRSGKLPNDQRVKWRNSAMLDDGKDVGKDLSGGYFDAGNHVKFGFPMAFTITTLAWGVLAYPDAFTKSGELNNIRKAIKWGTDYFIKCRTSETEFYGQVGHDSQDAAYWGRPEDWPKDKIRPSYKVTSARGGSDLCGETAAALAAASLVFKKVDKKYSATLLKVSKSLYTFADKFRATYTDEIDDAINYYKSWSGFGDELAWAAAWLLRVTGDNFYNLEYERHLAEFPKLASGGTYGWDDKSAGALALMAIIKQNQTYKNWLANYCDYNIKQVPRTPKGLIYEGDWGTTASAAGVAFICMQAAKAMPKSPKAAGYVKFAQQQIDYMLGDGGRSYVVGVGQNPPVQPNHRASSCPFAPAPCTHEIANTFSANPQTLYGALVSGPNIGDNYTDLRDDYQHNEVACAFNAPFVSALAGIIDYKNKKVI